MITENSPRGEPPLASLPFLMKQGWAAAPAALCPPRWATGPHALPDALGSSVAWALFEARLRSEAPRVDVAVMLGAGESRRHLRDWLVEEPGRWPPEWREAARAVVAWLLPGHPLAEAHHLSLEWDFRPEPAAPFSFVTFELAPGVASGRDRVTRIAEAFTAAVEGSGLRPVDRRVIELAPPGANLLHFGCMGERAAGARRWVIGMPPLAVEGFLRAMGWPGEPQQVAGWARELSPGLAHVSVHLDCADRVGERVGIEWFFPGPPGVDRRWSPLLDRLRRDGVADERCLAALGLWPGASGGLTRLLEVKVVFEPGVTREAKAYLAFTPTAPPASRPAP